MSSNRICHFKLVLLGDSAVGKSCLVVRFVRNEFFEFQEPTIGGYFLYHSLFAIHICVSHENGGHILPNWNASRCSICSSLRTIWSVGALFTDVSDLFIRILFLCSCFPYTNCTDGRFDSEIWNMGHGRYFSH